jgi:hypothetical protein
LCRFCRVEKSMKVQTFVSILLHYNERSSNLVLYPFGIIRNFKKNLRKSVGCVIILLEKNQ